MAERLVITSMLKDGIDVYKTIDSIKDENLLDTLKTKTYLNNAKLGDVTCISYKGKQIYSAIFSYKDDLDKRKNLYCLHIVSDDKIKGMKAMISNLAIDFSMLGLHKLDAEKLKILSNAIQNYDPVAEIEMDGHLITLLLKWAIN